MSKKIDDLYRNSDFPTRTQTEEAFGKMFGDMLGDLQLAIYAIGVAMVFALLFVSGNAMAMAMRELAVASDPPEFWFIVTFLSASSR